MKLLQQLEPLLVEVDSYSMHSANRLRSVIAQLPQASSVQEYQQIGIGVRDAWIELAQSLFKPEYCAQGQVVPGPADAKARLKYTLEALHRKPDFLVSLVRSAYDLANTLEHDLNATKEAAAWCISSTVLAMLLVVDLASFSGTRSPLPYYKCPRCGSLRLQIEDYWYVEYDGAWKLDKLVCGDCGWYYIEDLGGITGVD